jgi:hypothetical protein
MEEDIPALALPEHFLGLHLGWSEERLLQRAEYKNLRQASSFTDEETALLAISATLVARQFEIHEWLSSGSRERLPLVHECAFDVGIVARRTQTARTTRRTKVIVEPAPTPEGYVIVTAFPI